MPGAAEIVFFFFIYSILGWLWETVYCSINAGHFVYRGFLHGPYCPVYGFGLLLVLCLVMPLEEATLWLFIFSSIIVTVLEYITGYLLERVFKCTLWNYDDMPLNIHGRVAIPVSIFWGFCCVVVVRFIHPVVTLFVTRLYARSGLWLPATILLVMTADAVMTATRMLGFRKIMESMAEEFNESMETVHRHGLELQARSEEYWEVTQERLHKLLPQLRSFDRHILKAFPDIDMKRVKDFKEFKEYLKNYLNTSE